MAFHPVIGRMIKDIRTLKGAKVIVGFQSELGTNFNGETISSDEEMLKIASVHEYGCDITVTPKMRAFLHRNGMHLKTDTKEIHIPERSFVRRGYEENKASLQTEFRENIKKMLNGEMTADEVLHALGRESVEAIYHSMGDGTEPVSNYTLERRKANPEPQPLNDTGKLARHITYRIVKRGDSK